MKTIISTIAAAVLVSAFAVSADAATTNKKNPAMKSKQAACHAQAVNKYTAVHFLKRRAYEKKYMAA